jgi:hypothetical protein
MCAAEQQRALLYLQQVSGPLYEQWYLLHHRILRIVTNHAILAQQIRSYIYYAELLAEYAYQRTEDLPKDIPTDLLWQAGQRLYKTAALTCYLFETSSEETFPPLPLIKRSEQIEWEEISGVNGPLRARWKQGEMHCREYRAYPGVSSRIFSVLYKADLYSAIFIEDVGKCAPWFMMRFVFYMMVGTLFAYDGYEIVHAGAIALNGTGALLVGSPGSGKSTLVLSCLLQGLHYLADDVLFLAKDNSLVHMYAFPEDIGVRNGAWNLLGQYACMQDLLKDERQKRFVDVQQYFQNQVSTSCSVRVLLFVHARNRDAEFRAESLSRARAVYLLRQEYISHQKVQESKVGDTFALLTDMVSQSLAYRLWLTPDAQENARQVRMLLEQHKV